MKVKWWVMIAVFFLGVGVGVGISGWYLPERAEVPSFSSEPQNMQIFVPELDATEPTTAPTESDQQTTFPHALQYTSLVVEGLISYDGPWLEDGSEENVMGVAALLVRNTGTIGIEYARIALQQDGRELVFDATYIPPKGLILLLEEDQQQYADATVIQCRYRTVIPGTFDLSQRTVRIEEDGLGSLKITNLTDKPMYNLQVFYKHHEAQTDLYVGGITYSVVIPQLQPGETRTVTPYRYAVGYAMVVAVTKDAL